MKELSKECQKKTSGESYVAGALAQAAVWGTIGFLGGEALFGVGGPPVALIGVEFGVLLNGAEFGAEALSCKINNRTIGQNISDLFSSPAKLPRIDIQEEYPKSEH